MKILIAGGAGFIGSHLVDLLINQGHEVVVVDNLITGHEENLNHWRLNPKFQFLKLDVISELPPKIEVDQIYHLASPASPRVNNPRSYHALWEETMKVNTIGTWNLVDLALKDGAKFLFTSTSEIYGDPLEHPQKETYRGNVSTTGPRSVYDEAKRFGETIVAANVQKKSLDGRIVRIFNTYGPRMDLEEGRVIYTFIQQALKNEPITIEGDGTHTRSYCYVSDLVQGLFKAMEGEKTCGEVINLGNPGEFTTLELAEMIIKLTGSKSTFSYLPAAPDGPKRRRPDITKAKELLGWQPQVDLEEGLKMTINYVKEVLRV